MLRSAPRANVIPKFSATGKQSSRRFRQWRRFWQKQKMGNNMLNKLPAAAAMAAIAYVVVPANAARVSAGCSGENLAKTESSIEAMADGEGKIAARKEIALAKDARLNG